MTFQSKVYKSQSYQSADDKYLHISLGTNTDLKLRRYNSRCAGFEKESVMGVAGGGRKEM